MAEAMLARAVEVRVAAVQVAVAIRAAILAQLPPEHAQAPIALLRVRAQVLMVHGLLWVTVAV